jgi:alpha-glucosidase
VTVDYIDHTGVSGLNSSFSILYVMPSFSIALLQTLLLWSGFLGWGNSTPLTRAVECPGYKASNVVRSNSRLTADLILAGRECNLYSQDLKELKFVAEWQKGTFCIC